MGGLLSISFHKSRMNGVHNTHSTVNFTCCTHCLHMMTEQRTKLMQLFGHRSGCEILVWHHPDLHLPGALCANHSSSEHFQHQLILKVTLANCPPLETHSGTAPNGTKVPKWSQKVSIFKQGPKMVLS